MDCIAENICAAIDNKPRDLGAYSDLMAFLAETPEHDGLLAARSKLTLAIKGGWADAYGLERLGGWLRDALTLDGRFDLDAFMQAMEFDRDPESRLWLPRRSRLMRLCRELQWFETSPEAEFLSVSMPPRTGKALAFDTPVLTERGWREHGDLTIRDKVLGPDGEWKRIKAIHKPCLMEYEVAFANGERIVCHGNHEWRVFDVTHNKFRTLSVNDMLKGSLEYGESGKRGHIYRYQLPDSKAAKGTEKELAVAPYTLGAWLGDGRTSSPDVCNAHRDHAIIEGIVADGYPITWQTVHKDTGVEYFGFGRKLRNDFKTYGLCASKHPAEKFIPDDYFSASIEQRLELLAGLMDTDGCLATETRYTFSTCGEELKDSFIKLVSTFGWRCCVYVNQPKCDEKYGIRSKKPCYTLAFNPDMSIPCRLPRKRTEKFARHRRVSIVSIKPIEREVWGNCITVEGGMYRVGNTLVQTHNSSTISMASIWHMGRNPKPQNLVTAHSDALTQHFYEQLLEFASDQRYRFREIFPDSPLVWQSAEYESFSLKEKNSYPTCTCRSVGGTLTGAVEVGEGGWLVADDLIKELEEALSARRLQVKWEKFVNQCYDRRKKGSKVLMIGTRWAVEDPIGRMLALHEGEAGFHELTIPALDPKTGESNFDYLYDVGFDRHYYLDMQRTTDKATYAAKYDGRPIRREGQLFNPDDLERYLALPSGEPSQVVAVVDTKGTGVDYEAMPVLAQWEGNPRWYLVDCVCDNGKPDSVNVRVSQCLVKNGVQRVQFESNNGGDEYAKQVGRMLSEQGHLCAVQTKRTSSNKETRILAAQPWVQENVIFPDSSLYGQGTDMERFMGQLFGYVLDGKNPHDDAPDSLSMLANMLARRTKAKATSVRRPF